MSQIDRTDTQHGEASPSEHAAEIDEGDAEHGLVEQSLIDQIGTGLLGRYFGSVADPAGITSPHPVTEAIDDEAVVDLRDPTPRVSRRRHTRARWRAFKWFWWGHTASNIGDHLTILALPLAADRLTGSGLAVGAVVFAETLATVLLGSVAGAFTDRRHARSTMVAVDLCRALVLAGLFFLHTLDRFPVAVLIVAAFALGLLRLVFDGAQSSFVARLVPDELDLRSNNRLVLSENIGMTAGPILAGALIEAGLWLAFGFDAVSFLLSAAALLSVRRAIRQGGIELAESRAEATSAPSRRAEMRESFRLLTEHPMFLRSLVITALFNICTLPLGQQFVTLARRSLDLGPFGIGALFALGGVAGILAAPMVERTDKIRPAVLPVSTGVLGAAVMAVGLAPSIASATVAFLIGGVAFAYLMTNWAAMRQRLFPAELQGRVTLTARGVMWSSILVGSLATGRLSDVVSPEAMWITCGGVGVLACVGGLLAGMGRDSL